MQVRDIARYIYVQYVHISKLSIYVYVDRVASSASACEHMCRINLKNPRRIGYDGAVCPISLNS